MEMETLVLTEEQRAIRQMVRDFVDNEMRPMVREAYIKSGPSGQHDPPPEELVRKMDALGLRTLMVPEKYGGISYDMQTLAIIEEELARSGRRTGVTQNCWKGWDRLHKTLPQHIQDYWFPRIMEDPTFVICSAGTEPRGSSDGHLPYNPPEGARDTRAVLQDGHWVINGQKQFITNATSAKLIVVHGLVETDGRLQGSSFLVPLGTPGLTVGPRSGELSFQDCRVPEDHKLARDPDPFISRALITAEALGKGICAYDETVEFCRTRFQGGRYIIQHQLVGAALAEMNIRLESMRALVNWAARAADLGASDALMIANKAYLFAAQLLFDICRKAVELWGGMGTTPEAMVFSYLHMATVGLHLDGTMDVQRLRLAYNLFPETVGAYAGPMPEPQRAVPVAAD